MHLTEADLRVLVMMGPSAWHTSPEELDRRIEALGRAADVTAAFTVSAYQPVAR
jgi:hypothetical protein